MKKNNKIIISIISVLMIGIVVTGATFAYWSWVVDAENETDLDFTVFGESPQSELYATLDGSGTTEITSLQPTECNGKNVILKKVDITYQNKLKQSAIITATLQVSEFNTRAYIPTIEDLKYLKYALTHSQTSCETNVVKNSNGEELNGNLSKLVTENETIATLPIDLFSQTIIAPANMAGPKNETYYLWIWLDHEYMHINVGNNNTDPMQKLNFKLQWTGTIVQNPY